MTDGFYGHLFDLNFDGKMDSQEKEMEMAFIDYSHRKYGDYNIHSDSLLNDVGDMFRGVNPGSASGTDAGFNSGTGFDGGSSDCFGDDCSGDDCDGF